MRRVIAAAALLVASAFRAGLAQEPDLERVVAALRARESRAGKLRISAEWRWYRCAADDVRDSNRWEKFDFDFDLTYTIVRPWWRVQVLDLTQRRSNPSYPEEDYAWVEGELTSRTRSPGDAMVSFGIVNHRNLGTLRGKVFLTPVELEFFDLKSTLLELLTRAADVRLRREADDRVWLEFAHPQWPDGYTLRATLDLSRDAVPLVYECYTFIRNGKTCVWRMETDDVLGVGSSFIVGEAHIFNINPNVIPDTEEVIHYKVRTARLDPQLGIDDVRIVVPRQNADIYDIVRLEHRTYDGEGRLAHYEKLSMEELREQQQAWAVTARETLRRGTEQVWRRWAFGATVGVAGVLAALLALVVWRRRVRRAA